MSKPKYEMQYEGNFLNNHIHFVYGKEAQFRILNGGSKGHADDIAEKVVEMLNKKEK